MKEAKGTMTSAMTKAKAGAKATATPELRFPEFRDKGAWEVKRFGECCFITTGKLDANAMVENGQYRFYTCAKNYYFINCYAFDTEALLISGNGANVGYIHHYKGKFNAYQRTYILDKFDENILFIKYYLQHNLYKRISIEKKDGNTPYIVKSALTDMEVMLPHKDEQQKIADCLTSLDELISAEDEKLTALKEHKKGLLQNLFPAEGKTTPELRFPEFRGKGAWEVKRLGEVCNFQDGYAFPSKYFTNCAIDATQVIRITDINHKNKNANKIYVPASFLETLKLDKYMIQKGNLLLSLTGVAGFNFFMWSSNSALINQRTMKIAVKEKSNNALLKFLEYLIHKEINSHGTGQNNNLSKEILNCITFFLPKLDEQQKIADCLTSLDELISAQGEKLKALKDHKKGLMQKLFP